VFAKRKRLWIGAAALAVVAIVGGVGIAMAGGGDDNEQPITGTALQEASAAALAHTGEGAVTETEIGDEDGYYEVEVTLDDGSQVDVHLDQDFNVVSAEGDDDDGAEDESGPDDD
jgi:uncharacterized membrane protein YkoI